MGLGGGLRGLSPRGSGGVKAVHQPYSGRADRRGSEGIRTDKGIIPPAVVDDMDHSLGREGAGERGEGTGVRDCWESGREYSLWEKVRVTSKCHTESGPSLRGCPVPLVQG